MAIEGIEPNALFSYFVATGEPATDDVAGYKAITWLEIKHVTAWGAWGDEHAEISETYLTGRTVRTSGAADGGTVQISFTDGDTNPGGDLIKANVGNSQHLSFKKVYKSSGDAEFAGGSINSRKSREPGTGNRGFEGTIFINSKVVEATAAELAA